MIDYKDKYLKYKNKYLNLKNQKGGNILDYLRTDYEGNQIGNTQQFRNTPNDFEDLNRELKDISTDFVNKNFFKEEETLFNFLKIIVKTFRYYIDQYIINKNLQLPVDNRIQNTDIIFFFKGGNMYRYLSSKFLDHLPAKASNSLRDLHDVFYKRSDADFSILINPRFEQPLFDEIHLELTNITLHILGYLKKLFNENPNYYFDYFKTNEEEKVKMLNELFDNYYFSETFKPENPNWGDKVLTGIKFDKLGLDKTIIPALPNEIISNRNILNILQEKEKI